MTEFVASNGVSVRGRKAEGWTPLEWNLPTEDRVWRLVGESTERVGMASGFSLDSRLADAFREFFLAERDAELGRWRSKEHPDYVVYPKVNGCVRVVEEFTGQSDVFSRSDKTNVLYGDIAAEFFAAHPEPKPWHDAKPGEGWVVVTADFGERVAIVDDDFFMWSGEGVPILSEQITAGRRIWPET